MTVDIKIECVDCKLPFVWLVAEQKFFKEKGLLAPKRCRDCRKIRRAALNNTKADERQ